MPAIWFAAVFLLGPSDVSPEVVFERAVSALAAHDYGAAEQGFAAVLKKQPNHIGALGNLGVVYSRTQRSARAIFNVNCGERALLKNFDIYKEAGGENRAIGKTFRGIDPNPQDKLVLSFVPELRLCECH